MSKPWKTMYSTNNYVDWHSFDFYPLNCKASVDSCLFGEGQLRCALSPIYKVLQVRPMEDQ